MSLRRYLATAALVGATPAGAQVLPPITLIDLDARVTVATDRIDVLETRVNVQTSVNADVDARLQSNVAAVAAVDAKADTAIAATADLDTRVTANTDAIVAVNGRVDGAVSAIDQLSGRIDGNSAALVDLDARVLANTDATVTLGGRVDALGDQVAQNGAGLVNVNAAVGAIDARVTNNTTAITAIDARVTANDRRDDAQDVVLADHDARITRAQGTADTARVETTTLRADVDAGRAGLVRQAGPSAEVMVASTSGGDAVRFSGSDGDRRLTGVASGVASNDAATMGQLRASAADTLSAANSYTDRTVEAVMQRQTAAFDRMIVSNNALLKRDIDSSAAGSAALASLPQAIIPGAGLAGVSLGGKGDQVALALGVSKAFGGRHVPILRAGASVDTRTGDATYNAGVGIHF